MISHARFAPDTVTVLHIHFTVDAKKPDRDFGRNKQFLERAMLVDKLTEEIKASHPDS